MTHLMQYRIGKPLKLIEDFPSYSTIPINKNILQTFKVYDFEKKKTVFFNVKINKNSEC